MSRRTGRPNIGHATGRGVLPDGRIRLGAFARRGRDSSRKFR
ncbi:hypothetical protein [Evansella tamaricis]|nr:hypothetical protein [Evansella tamaricis]